MDPVHRFLRLSQKFHLFQDIHSSNGNRRLLCREDTPQDLTVRSGEDNLLVVNWKTELIAKVF